MRISWLLIFGFLSFNAFAASPAPNIGRLTPAPDVVIQGPQAAKGLIIWSHGYMPGVDATTSRTPEWIFEWPNNGYDFYRFNRKYVNSWISDARDLTNAVIEARRIGYKRIIIGGQSNGAWITLAAADNGAPVDGVIAMSPARQGNLKQNPAGIGLQSGEWDEIMQNQHAGPRFVIIIFKNDDYDAGGRIPKTRRLFAERGIDAILQDGPKSYEGHGAADTKHFANHYSKCLFSFIETGARSKNCSDK